MKKASMTIAFSCAIKPITLNVKGRRDPTGRRELFHEAIERAFRKAYPGALWLSVDSYGIVYYFPRYATQIDADNVSKPVWDSLKSVAYPDDRIICLRVAGIIEQKRFDFSEFDLTNVPQAIAKTLLAQIGDENHVLYIEIGALESHMIRFGLAVRDS